MSDEEGDECIDTTAVIRALVTAADGSRDQRSAVQALQVVAEDVGGAREVIVGGGVDALARAWNQRKSDINILDTLGMVAYHEPLAVAKGAGAILVAGLSDVSRPCGERSYSSKSLKHLLDALINITADDEATGAIVQSTPEAGRAILSMCICVMRVVMNESSIGERIGNLLLNISRSAEGSAALHRAGAVRACIDILVDCRRHRNRAMQSIASALLELCASPAPARALAEVLSHAPDAVLALASAALHDKCVFGGNLLLEEHGSAEDCEDAEAAGTLLRITVDHASFSASTLLREDLRSLSHGGHALSAVLALLEGSEDADCMPSARPTALALAARWADVDDGLALLRGLAAATCDPLMCYAIVRLARYFAAPGGALARWPEFACLWEPDGPNAVGRQLGALEKEFMKHWRLLSDREQRKWRGASKLKESFDLRRSLAERADNAAIGTERTYENGMTEADFAAREAAGESKVVHTCHGSLRQTGIVTVHAVDSWRALRFNGCEQGIIRLARDDTTADASVLCLDYVRALAVSAAAFCERSDVSLRRSGASAIVVGLGAGALPAFLSRAYPSADFTVIEIDEAVVDVVKKQLRLNLVRRGERAAKRAKLPVGDGRVYVEVADAYSWMARAAPRGKAALLVLDAYDGAGAIPAQLLTSDFFAHCVRALEPGGVVVCNVWNGPVSSPARSRVINLMSNLQTAMGNGGQLFTLRVASQQSNLVVIAVKAKPPPQGASASGLETAKSLATISRAEWASSARASTKGWPFDAGAPLLAGLFHAHVVRQLGGPDLALVEAIPGADGSSAVDLAKFTKE